MHYTSFLRPPSLFLHACLTLMTFGLEYKELSSSIAMHLLHPHITSVYFPHRFVFR
jgi:hypothetical protein